MRILNVSGGNGVLSYAFKQFVIGNIEPRSDYYIRHNTYQWQLNYDVSMVPEIDLFADEKVDVIVGHPKCGAYSILALSRGKTFKENKDEPSLTLFFSSIAYYKPKIFLMENLPKFLESHSKEKLTKQFSAYHLMFFQGPVTNFGNSQETRVRLVVVGIAKRLKKNLHIQDVFAEQYGLPFTAKPMKELLKDIPKDITGNFNEDFSQLVTLYSRCKITWEEIRQGWMKLYPNKRWLVQDRNFTTAPGVWNTWEEDLPLTIRKTNRQFYKGLPMTPRQLARCQGVPDDFEVLDKSYPMTTLLNKARLTFGSTPPYEIGKWFIDCLIKSNFMNLQEKYK